MERTEFLVKVDQVWDIPNEVDQEDVFDHISEALIELAESWDIHAGGSVHMIKLEVYEDKYGYDTADQLEAAQALLKEAQALLFEALSTTKSTQLAIQIKAFLESLPKEGNSGQE